MKCGKRLTATLSLVWVLATTLACLWTFAAAADDSPLPQPETDVLLKIVGNLSKPNTGDEVWLDRETLENLPSTTFITETPWTNGPQTFTGVRLSTLLERVGASPEQIEVTAVDNYRVTLHEVDYISYPVIVAYRQNGKSMSVRNLGPLRLIFPFSDYPELWTETNESFSVWQLIQLNLL